MSDAAIEPQWLWTWSGQPFGYGEGDDLWTYDGRHVGRFDTGKIFGPDGHYLGELLDGNRLITARFRGGLRLAGFAVQPCRTRSRRRARLVGYVMPTGLKDFPLAKTLSRTSARGAEA
jgi:hypothetical protein